MTLYTQINSVPNSSELNFLFYRCSGQQAGYRQICAGHIQILVQARHLKGSR